MNIWQQQDQLKGMQDDALQQEASNPSGSVPPFLVLTEINRRKTVRERYDGEKARRQPSTTVAEDLLAAPLGTPGRAALNAAAPTGGVGIAAALPQEPMPAFADGGIVPASFLEKAASRYMDGLDDTDSRRDRVFNNALIQAGAAMMSSGSPNFMRNLGAGVTSGIDSYLTQTEVLDKREQDQVEGVLGIHKAEQAERLAALDEDFRRDQEARLAAQASAQLNAPTSDMQNYEAFSALDAEGQANWQRVNGGSAASTSTRTLAMKAFADTADDVRKEIASQYEDQLKYATPEERAAMTAQMEAEIMARTQTRFQTFYPDYVSLMPELVANPAAAPAAPVADPLGLGL